MIDRRFVADWIALSAALVFMSAGAGAQEISVFSTFDADTPGALPATGGPNQPTGIANPWGGVLVQATAIGIATQPLEVSDADCSASPSPDQYPNFRRQLRVRRHLCVVERYWPFAGLGELVLRSHIVELDPMHVLARQERIGFLIYAPGIAGGDLERAREEIDALRNIDGAAADEMQQQLALRVEKNRRAADRSDG